MTIKTIKEANEDATSQFPEEHKDGKPVVVWCGSDPESNRKFRVVCHAYPGSEYGVSIGMQAEVRECFDAMGHPRWIRVDDKDRAAKYMSMAVYAKMIGLRSSD